MEMPVTDPKLVEVYRPRNLPEAHAIRIALEEAGIRVQIDNELLQGAVGELPMGWATAPRILVPEPQATEARTIMGRTEVQARGQPAEDEQGEGTRCLACGRVMAEAETKCPTCGWSYHHEKDA